MQRRSVDEYRELYVQAMSTKNWNDVAIWSTELLKLDQAQPHIWGNRGIALQNLGHPLDGLLNHQRALDYDSESVTHYCNVGACHQDLHQYDKALEFYHKALEVDSTVPQVYMNIGHIHKWEGRYAEALEYYRKSVEYGPKYVDGHLSYGFMLLKSGQLEEGWKEFEWRWQSEQLPPRGLSIPQWNDEDLNGKTILIYGEQGLGDIIQFARYARVLAGYYPEAKIILEGKQQVKRLLQTIPEVDQVINFGEKLPKVDYAIAMITLAGKLTPTLSDIPTIDREYLLKPDDVDTWRNKFAEIPAPHSGKIKVGICWAGMARMNNAMALKVDEMRSLALADFSNLVTIPDILWISLQKGPPAEQLKKPPAGMFIADYTEDMYDFYETCCAIEQCDLVITVDTAVCHAAASIGKPTWMLSRWDGCWRWFGDREDCPWYPSLRQFVQNAPDDWSQTMLKMQKELRKFVKDKRQPQLQLDSGKLL